MITFLLGLPGSGKTYFAVDRIYNNFSKNPDAKRDKKVTFQNCYTNINEFNFNNIKNVDKLDFEILMKILKRLHKYYKDKKTDEYIVKYCRRIKFKDTLFVIDEAHNYFDVKNPTLVWWLSYHRHLYHEIILITQNISLIESKYKSFSEFFYKAHAQSRTLDKRFFKYTIYCTSRMSENSKSGTIKVKRNPDVFDLYKSGDTINSTNVVLKYFLIAVAILVGLLLYLNFYVLNNDSNEVDPLEKTSERRVKQHNTIKNNIKEKVKINHSYKDRKLFNIACSISTCRNELINIPTQLLGRFINDRNIVVLYIKKISKTSSIYYLDTSMEFYSYLTPKAEHDNINKKNSSNKLDLGFLPTSK